MERFVDHSGSMTLDRIIALPADSFQPLKSNLAVGTGQNAVWVRFTFRRTPSFPGVAWLQLYPAYLDYVDLYAQSGLDPAKPASYHLINLGARVPAARRPLVHPEFVAPIATDSAQPCTVYLRLCSNSTVNLAGALHTLPGLIYHTSKITITYGGYLIMCLVLTLVNILIYLRLRDAIYLIFSAWIFTLFCSLLASSGIITLIFPAFAHQIYEPLYGAGLGIGGMLFTTLAMKMFETKRIPAFHYSLIALLSVAALAGLVFPVERYGETMPFMINSVFILLLLFNWPTFWSVCTIASGGMIFLVAFIITYLAYMVQFMHLLGWIPMNWWDINVLYFVSIADMILMFLAFLNRLYAAEKMVVEMARESEKTALTLAGEMTVELRERENQLELALASERVALEEQRRFLSMLSHEYRTPLSVIRGNIGIIELLEEGKEGRYRDKLDAIQISLDRLVEVMEVSLERSHLSDNGDSVGRQRIRLASFLASQIADARALWPPHVFIYSEPLDEHHVVGEPQYLKTALFNLLDNASKYSLRQSPIKVSCGIEQGAAVIRIENQTNSPVHEEGEELFVKYKRGSNTSNTSGAGIGLWLVRQIIMQHNGRVTLERSASRVVATVRLPLDDDARANYSAVNIPDP